MKSVQNIRLVLLTTAVLALLVGVGVGCGVLPQAASSTPTPRPGFTPVTANADWTPVIKTFDGVAMALVPAGCFPMGSEDGGGDEAPVHTVCFEEPFWIDVTEVTNAQYGSTGAFSEDDLPREAVTWDQALAHCEGRGGRLPTEAEWEYAARGPDGLVYPWGDAFDGGQLNFCDTNCVSGRETAYNDGYANTAPVGSYPGGVSWVGAVDLSGNVWEWVNDWYGEDYYGTLAEGVVNPQGPASGQYRVLRGGSWLDAVNSARAASRGLDYPFGTGLNLGFRCARSDDGSSAALPAPQAQPTHTRAPADPSGFTPVTANADWAPVIETFDGVAMALVPAGCFPMGSEDGGGDETPVHTVCFEEPFWIDVTEVTNGQYGSYGTFSGDTLPREVVTWFEALAHCEGRGARLPTEAEWEYAARGPDGLVYPWGNTFVADNLVDADNSGYQTAPVGSRPGGVSWIGAVDLSGNVWEWVNDWYGEDYYGTLAEGVVNPQGPASGQYRILRGGSWYYNGDVTRAAYRFLSAPGGASLDGGYRCARSYDGSNAASPASQAQPTHTRAPADPSGFTPVTANADWAPVIETFDGVAMALVPAGCFPMGSEDGDGNETPVHTVCFEEPFWIDVTEVTNGQYGSAGRFPGDDRPRETVTWFEALAHCEGRGARLPTEAELGFPRICGHRKSP